VVRATTTVRWEQDGAVERQIKANWIAILAQYTNVERAYLARVVYEDPQAITVAMAIRSVSGQDDRLEEELGKCFAKIFRRDAHLDIVFISAAQEAELSLVCRPFYQSGQYHVSITLAAP
jgi:hypothetical protein